MGYIPPNTGSGPQGPQGDAGVQGIQGIQGTQGDQGIQGVPPDPVYGELYVVRNGVPTTINSSTEWHALELLLEGLSEDFTYQAGINGAIASIADAGGGDILITDVDHALSVGEIIAINGCADAAYVGLFEVKTVPTDDTFTVTAVYTATDTGFWQRGANLTVVNAGVYSGKWAGTGISAVNAHIFDFAPGVNVTISVKAESRRKFSNADYGAFGGTGLMSFSVGDKVAFYIQNVGNTGDVTIRTLDLNILRT